MAKRVPLVIILLRVPFRLAVAIKDYTNKCLSLLFQALFQFIIFALSIFNFRKGFIQLAISGFIKSFVISSSTTGLIYYYIKLLSQLWYYEHYIISSLIVIAEIIVTSYILKKGWNLVPIELKDRYITLVSQGFMDFISLILTILTILTIVGISEIKNRPEDADQYFIFILQALTSGISNIIELPFMSLLIIFPWRLYIYLDKVSEMHGAGNKIKWALFCFLNGFIDIPFAVMAIILMVTIFNLKFMICHIKNRELSRMLIFEKFLHLILIPIFIVIAMIVFCGIVRARALYKTLRASMSEGSRAFEIIMHFVDTVIFIPGFVGFLLVLIPFYRFKHLEFNFDKISNNSDDYHTFLVNIIIQIAIEIADFLHILLLALCVVFFYRFIPFIKDFKFNILWHIEVEDLFIRCIADVPATIFGLFILITLYRIPLTLRRKKFNKGHHWLKLTSEIIKEILKDFLVMPFFIAKLICPWRLIPTIMQIWKTSNPKDQRKIMKEGGFRPIEDYVTIILAVILFLSVWRTAEIISLMVTHIRQIIKHEVVTSSLFRKVFRKFCQLLIDIFMVFLMLLILVMIIEVPNLIRRMRSFYLLYKERRGFRFFSYFAFLFPKKQPAKEKKEVINKLSKNVFTNISSFLDMKALGNVAQANKKFKDLVSFQPIWKEQYEKYWKNYIPASSVREMAWDDDYKKLAVEGYTNFIQQNKDVILDEEERGFRMGARAIVLEEFILSIFGFPHIIALPAKAAIYFLSKINYKLYFQTPRYSNLFSYEIWINPRESFTTAYNLVEISFKKDEQVLKNFYHVQWNCLYIIISNAMVIVEQVCFFICGIDLLLLKIFSFGTSIPLRAAVIQRNAQLKPFLYSLQLGISLLIISTKFLILVCPFMISYQFTSYTLIGCIFGPGCLNILVYFILYCNLMTIYVYFGHFPQFRPHLAGAFLLSFGNRGFDIGKILVCAVGKFVNSALDGLSGLLKGLKVFLPKGQIFRLYKEILIFSGEKLKNWGYLGDLIYTPLVLIWIFWPLLIPYLFENWYLLFPIFPLVVFLLLKGYSIAKASWEDEK
ncbi:unnamed protein product [Blepharisma stoltei]|uniref:F-box domain-containing protein n=1 Tax=Blepharisma stoltei TaxID=1481888 RepID=A0AAU9IMF3_9CILI|nr:unnamed protein product [Blepharisma stoltei]